MVVFSVLQLILTKGLPKHKALTKPVPLQPAGPSKLIHAQVVEAKMAVQVAQSVLTHRGKVSMGVVYGHLM